MWLKILVKNKKAIGIEHVKRGKIQQFYARKEVIIAGGAINSPHLLMLSGIGDASELRQHETSCH